MENSTPESKSASADPTVNVNGNLHANDNAHGNADESAHLNGTANSNDNASQNGSACPNSDPRLNLLAPCPITQVLEIIAAKWTVEILREVAVTPTRTRKFLRVIPGLSMKSLQVRLKELEKYGLIERKEYDVLPRHVDHLITERGEKVLNIYMQIKSLADEMFHSSCVCPMDRSRTPGGCTNESNGGCTSNPHECTADSKCTTDAIGCRAHAGPCGTEVIHATATGSHACTANTCPHRPKGRD